ncbi:glucan endo-1,3-beta-glucosidase 12-like [Silene latifolia]|uniref:glucan endo-1,3-beta-glucosidase 12-like n=1 Tax=Silene latifolia TaxID=37657 RepID=UPI003D77B383
MVSYLPCLLFSLLLLSSSSFAAETGKIGINYGRIANNLPTPTQVVQLLKSQSITRAKLYDSDPTVLKAFANSGISLVVALPNENLTAAANSQSYTDTWVETNIVPYHPATAISAIAVGNEVNVDSNNVPHLVPAMSNLYESLKSKKLDDVIKISSPISFNALGSSYPSSSGVFKEELVSTLVQPMLEFLKKTSSYLMVNAYPFFAYSGNSDQIGLDYALFRPNSGVVDSGNGLKYTSLFEAQLDAVFAAMSALKFDDVKVVVTETGWPSQGDENEVGANAANAASYNGNLVKRVLTGGGTPLRPNDPLDVYLFALFNENQKTGPTSERNYGLFYPNQEKVYSISLTGAGAAAVAPAVNEGSKVIVTGQTWCVANEEASKEKLQNGLDWACGAGQADCRPIQPGATCYNPGSLVAHASYAFNSYYQLKARASGTCDFGGVAHVVSQSPKFGACTFPTGY